MLFSLKININCIIDINIEGQELESEANDRANMALPGHQLQLLQDAVAFAGWYIFCRHDNYLIGNLTKRFLKIAFIKWCNGKPIVLAPGVGWQRRP